MLKKAAIDGLNWLIISLIFNIILIPADILFHLPILSGLPGMFIQSKHKLLMVTVLMVCLLGGWLVIFLISLVGRWLNQYMGRNDRYKQK